ncbi:hypothetical protein BGX26_002769, partial [Mortierella sp. AD094]
MTSVATSPQSISGPHVKVERSRVTSPTRENSRSTNVVSPTPKSPTTPAQRPSLATNKRFSNVQSKVGSLEAINYKPKPSEKKIQSFKQDFSHVKSKVDAKLVLPTPVASAEDAVDTAAPASDSPSTSATAKTARVTTAPAKRPTIVTTGSRNNSATGAGAKVLSPTSRAPFAVNSVRNSTSSATSSAMSPTSSTRRMSKHIIPTQKVQYDNVKAKVGSFDNISYASRGRASSRSSSADEGNSGA